MGSLTFAIRPTEEKTSSGPSTRRAPAAAYSSSVKQAPPAGPGLDHDLVAVVDELRHPVRLHGDAPLHVLDLLRHPHHRL